MPSDIWKRLSVAGNGFPSFVSSAVWSWVSRVATSRPPMPRVIRMGTNPTAGSAPQSRQWSEPVDPPPICIAQPDLAAHRRRHMFRVECDVGPAAAVRRSQIYGSRERRPRRRLRTRPQRAATPAPRAVDRRPAGGPATSINARLASTPSNRAVIHASSATPASRVDPLGCRCSPAAQGQEERSQGRRHRRDERPLLGIAVRLIMLSD